MLSGLTKAPETVAVDDLLFQEPIEATFEGWQPAAFTVLDRLKKKPHIDQYREERDAGRLDAFIKKPFSRYRDDLVFNWILPSRLKYETELYVFSRLLKNDFGAGGCHHHKWLAFYRPHRRRLTDVQITHTILPAGMDIGVFVGKRAGDVFQKARGQVVAQPKRYFRLVNNLLENGRWRFYYRVSSRMSETHESPLEHVPEEIERADGLWIRRRLKREEISEMTGTEQLQFALQTVVQVWPLYQFYLTLPRA